ncbi:MAG: MATE family efflux transporter [Clostridia bacterium]|nr:MATE family efflux transporter [Clostridia bacterium]
MSSTLKENKMGVMPVHKLLLSMALPMMASMLVQALYNIVDSIYVARLSEDALTAVTLAFPIQNLMIAVGSGTGVGINALLSRSLGEKNHTEVSRAATNGIFLMGMSYLLFLLFGIFGAGMFVHSLAKSEIVAAYATNYLSLCCMLSFGIFGQFVFERLLQSTGKTLLSMITQSVGAIINIILDPFFIFGWCGFPRLEVAGAAVATVFGQVVAMTLAIIFNLTLNKEIHLSFKGFRPNARTIGRIYAVGLPSIFMMSIASIMNYFLNMILISLHTAGVAVFGAYFKLQSFIFMPVFGLNNGMVPIIAYNYGAKNRSRITKTIRLSITYAVCLMLLGWVLFQTIPEVFLSFFNLSESTLPVAIKALQTISYSFLFAGFCIIIVSVFQALSHGVLSLVVSVIRQLVVLIPVAFLLSLSGNIDLVWWAFPIAEIASLVFCVLFLVRIYRKEIRILPE